MFIDYVTLMLINMAAGFFVLAGYLIGEEEKPVPINREQSWAPVFALVGVIALITGFRMTFTWPLPGSYNIAFGELSVLFGGLMLAGAWSLAKELDLKPVSLYGFFAGLVSIVVGVQFLRLGLSQTPLLTGTGLISAGIAGLGAYPTVKYDRRSFRVAGVVILILSGLIWAYIGYSAYWHHIESFIKR